MIKRSDIPQLIENNNKPVLFRLLVDSLAVSIPVVAGLLGLQEGTAYKYACGERTAPLDIIHKLEEYIIEVETCAQAFARAPERMEKMARMPPVLFRAAHRRIAEINLFNAYLVRIKNKGEKHGDVSGS